MNYIIEKEKKFLLDVIWNNGIDDFQSDITFLPHYEEQVKYEIAKTSLTPKEREILINKVVELYGEYSEDIPTIDGKYYFDFYYQ